MLQEMCSAIGFIGLGARTGINPDADCAGLRIWRVLSRNLEVRSACNGLEA